MSVVIGGGSYQMESSSGGIIFLDRGLSGGVTIDGWTKSVVIFVDHVYLGSM